MKKSRFRHNSPPPLPAPPVSAVNLANGIVDDFNNILTTVMGACSLIDKEAAGSTELLQYVNIIRASAERAASLSDKLAQHAESHQNRGNKNRLSDVAKNAEIILSSPSDNTSNGNKP